MMSPLTLNGHSVPKPRAAADSTGTQHCPAVSSFLSLRNHFTAGWEWRGTARSSLPPTDFCHRGLGSWEALSWRDRPTAPACIDVATHPCSSLPCQSRKCWLQSPLQRYHYLKQWLFHYCGKRDCGHLKEQDRVCNIIR